MDKRIKALLREEARRIVARDRSARKHGASHNLPDEIAAALLTAYKLGVDQREIATSGEELEAETNAALPWDLIPPTSRTALRYLTSSFSQRNRKTEFIPDELIGFTDDKTGRHRWRFAKHDGSPSYDDHSIADKGVKPLLRLGLLEPKDGNSEHLILTDKGDATCRLYWVRSDRNDPTLPVISLRG